MDWLWPHVSRWFLIAVAIAVYLALVTTPLWLQVRRAQASRAAPHRTLRRPFRPRHAL